MNQFLLTNYIAGFTNAGCNLSLRSTHQVNAALYHPLVLFGIGCGTLVVKVLDD